MNNNIKIVVLIFSSILCFSCSSNNDQNEKILAKIGNKSISLNEFIRRAEYTIRPDYCRNSTNVDKKIILNSLIAEKLFSLKAGHESEFLKKQNVATYLQGRKEQAMRQLLYKQQVTDKVKLDEDLIERTKKYVPREYDVSYISMSDTTIANQIKEELSDNSKWEEVLTENYNLKNIPSRKVVWNNGENYKMLDLLFTNDIKKDTIIGPIAFSEEHIMFLKINGWVENKIISEKQDAEWTKNIVDVYTQRNARAIYESYIREIMKDENIQFDRNTFFALADIIGPVFIKSKEDRDEALKKGLWSLDKEQQKYKDVEPRLEEIKSKTLYSIGGQEFTVSDFLNESKVHPLVFREKTFAQNEFGFQLQMAIIDQVRDRFLTEEAYKNSLDNSGEVKRNVNMWADYLSAMNYKYNYLKSNGLDSLYTANSRKTIEEYLNPIIDDLQSEYSKMIEIDTELFNSIKLARIDMSVIYNNAPFVLVVPSFPLVTTDNKLDYGKSAKELN